MSEEKREIVKIIQSMSGSYSAYNIFSDWVEMMAISIQNGCYFFHDELWEKREKQYLNIIKKYTENERKMFPEMFGLLCEAFENEEMTDVLGEIYMESGCANKNTGQFFTPFHLSYLCAQALIPEEINEKNRYIINEPSTGGGGMIIAAAKVLKDRGLNYQKCMDVTAQDLDWKGVYMTYVQLSLLGITATVVQGDTIAEPYDNRKYSTDRVFRTPMRMWRPL